jgi:hypothetical protein
MGRIIDDSANGYYYFTSADESLESLDTRYSIHCLCALGTDDAKTLAIGDVPHVS